MDLKCKTFEVFLYLVQVLDFDFSIWKDFSYFISWFFIGALKDAFSHCRSVEKTAAFNDSIEWLECAVDIFDNYQEENGLLPIIKFRKKN